ncbi:NAD(P)/FAD-dependent oxidoreductase [Spartinivicinus poritis]|uniref:NAD(P)/FAD-dependent oxidoreductase n=1 Tax=Spartinivicinus poritis TaxID=2994640 RepID=A0ABT5U231_9GAMM|nr:NAD(P)/FAD-dependent oxidoreductase [Spartinivicinus sp. A2-2]MDE1460352.1 NAD(P)/FAD-dependent oxidoreductase [Spartinivicinus sp. A2-2]
MKNQQHVFDVIVIGAGPSGAVVSSILNQQGLSVLVVEKALFPRFSIGESLLPQAMTYLEAANLLQPVVEAGFQYKNGAVFRRASRCTHFDFREKFSSGWGTTYQVKRAAFDKVLADAAEQQGVQIKYGYTVTAVNFLAEAVEVCCVDEQGNAYRFYSQFLADASGFGRVLPRLLDLETPSCFPVRQSLFTHIKDNIVDENFDRNKILITIHPEHQDVWYWLIPFSDGTSSIGVVVPPRLVNDDEDNTRQLQQFISEATELAQLTANAEFINPAQKIVGYSANVSKLWGDRFVLLGNAAEFLDPVFSSGVTIALKSAHLAAGLIVKQVAGEAVDWQTSYHQPLMQGIDTFRCFVESWYDGSLQNILFFEQKEQGVERMICSILAGYAWDETNPYVADCNRRLNVLKELCS